MEQNQVEIRETMTDRDIQIVLQRARDKYSDARPQIIMDNGSHFVSRDFRSFLALCQMTHLRTSPYYPQSYGKIERWHKSLEVECIRPGVPLSLVQTHEMVSCYVNYYNDVSLHSAIGYVMQRAELEGRAEAIQAERQRRLAEAIQAERQRRLAEAREARKCHDREAAAVMKLEHPTTEAHAVEIVAAVQAASSIALSQ